MDVLWVREYRKAAERNDFVQELLVEALFEESEPPFIYICANGLSVCPDKPTQSSGRTRLLYVCGCESHSAPTAANNEYAVSA
jgi:hypothetical protein